MSGFTPAQRRLILARDRYCIPHMGMCYGPLVIHHRRNRGMGGDPTADVVSNGLVVCDSLNTAWEQDAALAEEARRYGWKLRSFHEPSSTPVFVPEVGDELMFDDAGHYLDKQGEQVLITRV